MDRDSDEGFLVAEQTTTAGAEQPTTDTVMHALARAVAAVPDEVFLDFSGDLYTYAETDRLATRFAHELESLGVAAGRTVVTVLDNTIDQIVSWLALNKLGAVWVPLNTAYRGEFLRHQIDDSTAAVVVADAAYLPAVAAVSADLPRLELVLRRGEQEGDAPACAVPVMALDDHRGADDTPIPVTAGPGDLALLVYTSGTTGASKGCMISHNFICHQARQSNESVPPLPGEVMYTPLPLFHAAAVEKTLSALLARGRIAISRRFSVSRFWSEIERSGAGNVRLMASIFPLLAAAPDTPETKRCFGQLRAVTGMPFPPELRRVWKERFGVQICNAFAYGQSEGARLSTWKVGEPDPPEDSCGHVAAESYEVVVLDEDDNVLADGQVGEMAFRPRRPHVMFAGYWRQPEATAAAWRNLWMHTGDLGRIEDGYLYFVDRKRDYLRSRGENISSYEVERAFLAHPDLREVAAHAVAGGVAEDNLKITATRRPGATVTERALCLWAMDNVPYFAVPRYIEFRDELPKTPTNKVQKGRLRDEGCTPRTWDREAAGITVRRR